MFEPYLQAAFLTVSHWFFAGIGALSAFALCKRVYKFE